MQRPYDIIVWGASGFTGRLCAQYLQQQYGQGNLRWAIAGRNPEKLDSVKPVPEVEVLEADSFDKESLTELVKQTKVILTTVGPYARYGSLLVEVCAEQGTHYCDLTGETYWLRRMIDAHQETAQDSGAILVPMSGFDSIPSDLGCFVVQNNFIEAHGKPADEVKFRTLKAKGGFSGGTIDSMMAMMEAAKEDRSILKILSDPYALNSRRDGLDGPDSNTPFYDEDFQSWVGPFVMAPVNTRVVRRSNELLGYRYGHDFRYHEGMLTQAGPLGAVGAGAIAAGMGTFAGLAMLEPTRKLLQRVLPKPGEGPSEDMIENGFFEVELMAKHSDLPGAKLGVKVSGKGDPGYGSTSKMLAETAACLAQDEPSVGGGFWTSASALGDKLVERLSSNADVSFEPVSY
ncbi:MAG: saccharopine dehydrogenase NADP-binding domain-containing protein [Pseudomonadota bacterium]